VNKGTVTLINKPVSVKILRRADDRSGRGFKAQLADSNRTCTLVPWTDIPFGRPGDCVPAILHAIDASGLGWVQGFQDGFVGKTHEEVKEKISA